jgi:hypothetical protein
MRFSRGGNLTEKQRQFMEAGEKRRSRYFLFRINELQRTQYRESQPRHLDSSAARMRTHAVTNSKDQKNLFQFAADRPLRGAFGRLRDHAFPFLDYHLLIGTLRADTVDCTGWPVDDNRID